MSSIINNEQSSPIQVKRSTIENKFSEDKLSKLKTTLQELKTEHAELRKALSDNPNDAEVDMRVYDKETKKHIQQLKKYNELKDLSMNLIQMIADQKQTTLRKVMDEMGIEDDD